MISKRLLTIASLIDNDAIVADIGSDHALLPCYLVREGIVSKAYAVDNKQGPLNAAIENIDAYGFQEQIIPVLSAGLNNLKEDVNTVVIAGMGYSTISKIILDDLELAKRQNRIIIQCNNHLHKLRQLLFDLNFDIEKEAFLIINDVEYIIMAVKYIETKLSKPEIYISEYLLKMNDKEYIDFLHNRKVHLEDLKSYNDDFKIEYKTIVKHIKS